MSTIIFRYVENLRVNYRRFRDVFSSSIFPLWSINGIEKFPNLPIMNIPIKKLLKMHRAKYKFDR